MSDAMGGVSQKRPTTNQRSCTGWIKEKTIITFGLPYPCLEHKKGPEAPLAPSNFQLVSGSTSRRSETTSVAPELHSASAFVDA
jgi:hypothetical protein